MTVEILYGLYPGFIDYFEYYFLFLGFKKMVIMPLVDL